MSARPVVLAFLFACSHSKSERIETTQETLTSGRETTASESVTTVLEGPGRTIVLDFAPPSPLSGQRDGATDATGGAIDPDDATQAGSAVPAATTAPGRHPKTASAPYQQIGHGDGLPPHGALLKATITERGPVVQETHATAQGASETSAKADTHIQASTSSKTSLGPPAFVWLLLPVVVLAALAALWKFRGLWLG